MDTNMNDGEKIIITFCKIIIGSLISLLLSALLIIVYAFSLSFSDEKLKLTLEYTLSVLQVVFPIFLGYLGIEVFRNRNKGTKYYSMKYGRKKLLGIMNPLLENYNSNSATVEEFIQEQRESKNYFNLVFKLQSVDDDFNKLWNDFNYYSNPILRIKRRLNILAICESVSLRKFMTNIQGYKNLAKYLVILRKWGS